MIFFFIAAAFVIFITQRGELRTYLGFLYGDVGVPAATPSTNITGASGQIVQAAQSIGNTNTPGSPATSFSNWLTGALGFPSSLPLN